MKTLSRIAISVLAILFFSQFFIHKPERIIAYGDSITYQQRWYPAIEQTFGEQILNCGLGGTGVACRSGRYWLISNNGRGIRHYMTRGQAVWQYLLVTCFNMFARKYEFPLHIIKDAQMNNEKRLSLLPEHSDIILFMGGTNDGGSDLDEFKMNYMQIVGDLGRRCDKLVLISPIYTIGETEDSVISVKMSQFRDYMDSLSTVIGVQYVDMTRCGITKSNLMQYTKDGTHPNEEGGALMGYYINSQL